MGRRYDGMRTHGFDKMVGGRPAAAPGHGDGAARRAGRRPPGACPPADARPVPADAGQPLPAAGHHISKLSGATKGKRRYAEATNYDTSLANVYNKFAEGGIIKAQNGSKSEGHYT